MSLLSSIFSNESVKKSLLKKVADTMREQGIKKIMVEFPDKGEPVIKELTEEDMLIKKSTFLFMQNRYEKTKHLLIDKNQNNDTKPTV